MEGLPDGGPAGDEVTLLSQGQPGTVLVHVFKNGPLTSGQETALGFPLNRWRSAYLEEPGVK